MVAVLDDPEVPSFKAGFIVPKALGNAVARNRLRRRLREIVKAAAPALRSHVRIVTLARRGSPSLEFGALKDEWLRLARRAGVLRMPSVSVP
jgi:ribonuclease P protein component